MRLLAPLFALALLLTLAGCGKPAFKTFSPSEGGYSILMPGSPKRIVQNQHGLNMTTYEGKRGNESYAVSSGSVPPGGFDLGGAVWGLAEKTGARHSNSNGESRNGDGWREFEIESNKFYSGRVLVARGRFYMFLAAGPNARLSDPQVRAFIDSFRLTDGDTPGSADWASKPAPDTVAARPVGPAPAPITPAPVPPAPIGPTTTANPEEVLLGHPNEPPFRDEAPAGGLLVGFDLWYGKFFNNDVIWAVRPIYRTGGVDTLGQFHGTDTKRGVRVLANPGYAVGAVTVRTGLGVDAVTVTFMKVSGDRLEPNDSYTSEQMGGPGGGPTKLGGDGTPITGIIGRKETNLSGFGLAYRK